MMTVPFTCADFEAHLADYLEPGGLDARRRASADAHRAHCTACDTLVRELEQVAARAAALPPLTPSRDLWSGVAERLDARVVALPTGMQTVADRPARAPRTIRIEWFAAAAAVLVVLTAGGTWRLARARFAPAGTVPAVAQVPATAAPTTPTPAESSLAERGPTTATDGTTGTATTASSVAPVMPRTSLSATATAAVPVRAPTVEVAMSREIEALRAVVDDRFTELDSTTVEVIKRNLRIIDAAIAESRRALRQDPRSRFLADQLDRALARKVELLRQAALLERGT
ncbi:MAG: zf-HC2 domain-containing protein [Gemmatimonadaceae bacterium]|nr:zf-HC2 domain-containing protein [Gemmatimonadaceae bacterium]